MGRYTKLTTEHTYRISMIMAPLLMVVAMLLITPQQQLLGSLEGSNLFLRSIAGEPASWNQSHLAMLIAMLLFPFAFIGLYRKMMAANFYLAMLGVTLAYAGVLLLVGQLTLDFVYGAIVSNGADLASASASCAVATALENC